MSLWRTNAGISNEALEEVSVPPTEPQPVPIGLFAATAPVPGTIALVGPSNAGKTSFLGTLGEAFAREQPPAWRRFVPARELSRLMNKAASPRKAGEPFLASSDVAATYTFQLGLRTEGSGTAEMEVSVLDTPGSFFEVLSEGTSDEAERNPAKNLLRAVRNSHCLVLCVSATGHQPIRLAGFFNNLLTLGSRRVLRMGAKPWPARESPWERPPRLELPFDRVLVMLTGIDALCRAVARDLVHTQEQWLTAPPAAIKCIGSSLHLSDWNIAEILDPLPLVADRIIDLPLLASSLNSSAQLAFCAVSTLPLERTPPPRTEHSAPRDPHSSLPFELAGPEVLVPPAPFGIWPSVLFMTTGQVVAPLSTMDLDTLRTPLGKWVRLSAVFGEGT